LRIEEFSPFPRGSKDIMAAVLELNAEFNRKRFEPLVNEQEEER
jgi:hypothetical protein